MPTVHLAHLEEEDTNGDEDQESNDPRGIEGVMEEFMTHLARAVKDAQVDEKRCYHCSSMEHFICHCPLIKTSREKRQLNATGGDGEEGTLDPSGNSECIKKSSEGSSQSIKPPN